MFFCAKCHTPLVDKANYCHHCGVPTDSKRAVCSACHKTNPSDAAFCYGCGLPMAHIVLNTDYHTASKYDFEVPIRLEDQLRTVFFEAFNRYVAWIAPDKADLYLKSLILNNFMATLNVRIKQLAETYTAIYFSQSAPSIFRLERQLEQSVATFALYHLAFNTKHINPFPIPEAITHYERVVLGHFDLKKMIFDYLDLDKERLTYYTDFIQMPREKMENAAKHFLFAAKEEMMYCVADLSLFGNGKEGFALTENGLYWKMPSHKAEKLFFHQIARLEYKKSWVEINNRFFNVSHGFNVKFLFLLEKLQSLYV